MHKRPRILFLSHSASRNGASILLLHLVQWLRDNTHWDVEVLMNGRGALVSEFRDSVRTTIWRDPAALLDAVCRPFDISRARNAYMKTLMVGRRFDLLYANTCATIDLVRLLGTRNAPSLLHVHELEYAIRVSLGRLPPSEAFRIPLRFVAVSQQVRETLASKFDVPRERIDVVPGFIRTTRLSRQEWRTRRERVRQALGWPLDAFVVGGCGATGWRKGSDLFLQIAHRVAGKAGYDNVRFLWVGGDALGRESLEFSHDLSALRLHARCVRISTTSDVVDFHCAMDVLALTSREDPFPLVMLEAAALGLPTVCFAGSGGAPEFLRRDAGFVVPYLDADAFAQHLMTLRDSPLLTALLGDAAARRVCEHHSIHSQAPKLAAIIDRCMESSWKAAPLPASSHDTQRTGDHCRCGQ
jgi:glycosyltransferase involved in cell wall biosynthesis